MRVSVKMDKDRSHVRRAMRITMGRGNLLNEEGLAQLDNETFMKLLLGMHSPLEEMEFWIEMIVPERVHTHLVRHEEIGKYVATSRNDLKHATFLPDNSRCMALRINAKRLIEISEQRLCSASWSETREVFTAIREQIKHIDPILFLFLTPPCDKRGHCTEVNTDCGRDNYASFKEVANYIRTGDML